MSRSHYIFVAFCSIILPLTGCARDFGPPSPYADYYTNRLRDIELPDSVSIQHAGTRWTFHQSPEDVWEACLSVAMQYEGILAIDADDVTGRRMIFLHGCETPIEGRGGRTHPKYQFGRILDTWIAVAVTPANGGTQSDVAVAWISPRTGKPAPFDEMQRWEAEDSKKASAIESTVAIPSSRVATTFDTVSSALQGEEKEIVSRLRRQKKPEDRVKFVPQLTMNAFFHHLTTQLYGPERWQKKFATLTPPPTTRHIDDLERDPIRDKYVALESNVGNWSSARFRRMFHVVHCPMITAMVNKMADQLKDAASEEHRAIAVYVVSSRDINAFVLPNGDVFLCTGILEALDTPDELAAVLAHELDHVFQHDTIHRLVQIQRAQNLQITLAVVGGIAGGVLGPLAAGPAALYGTAASSLSAQILSNVVSNSIQMASGVIGQSIASSIILGYSRKTELRADSNGAKYLWAAGYDVGAELALLEKLQAKHPDPKKRKEEISSGFVNSEPGLEERIKKLRSLVADLRERSPGE